MESRLRLLMADNWDSFNLGMFVKREEPLGDHVLVDENKRMNNSVNKLVPAGEYSKAMQIVSAGCKQLDRTPALYDILQAKHPPKGPSHLSQAELKQIRDYSIDIDMEHRFKWETVQMGNCSQSYWQIA
jgi:hypothetical protein